MSKWKDKTVKIVQIVPNTIAGYHSSYNELNGTIGLGSDSKLYKWDVKAGKWEKAWDISNE